MIIKCDGKRCNKKIPKGVIKKAGKKFFCSNRCYDGEIYRMKLKKYQIKTHGRVITKKEARRKIEARTKKAIETWKNKKK